MWNAAAPVSSCGAGGALLPFLKLPPSPLKLKPLNSPARLRFERAPVSRLQQGVRVRILKLTLGPSHRALHA